MSNIVFISSPVRIVTIEGAILRLTESNCNGFTLHNIMAWHQIARHLVIHGGKK